MKVTIDITPAEVRKAVQQYIKGTSGLDINPDHMSVQVRSSQNYKNKEWEMGEIRIIFIEV